MDSPTPPQRKPVVGPDGLIIPAGGSQPPTAPLPPPDAPQMPQALAQSLSDVQAPGIQAAETGTGAQETLGNVAGKFWHIIGIVTSWFIFPMAVVVVLHFFVFQAYHVMGSSMSSTLHDADYLIVSKMGYTSALIQRTFNKDVSYIPKAGQIIVFHYPRKPSEVFVKRVIGIPGDRVVVKEGKITVYNTAHPDGYDPDTAYEAATAATQGNIDETVQKGNVFVVGDNRAPGASFDSREWGQLPSSYIIGNAVLRLLPLDQIKVL
jgi:signal peptidase I